MSSVERRTSYEVVTGQDRTGQLLSLLTCFTATFFSYSSHSKKNLSGPHSTNTLSYEPAMQKECELLLPL